MQKENSFFFFKTSILDCHSANENHQCLVPISDAYDGDFRCEDFNTAWQSLFKLRWPLGVKPGHDSVVTVDWQQQYWERHLQEYVYDDLRLGFLYEIL